VVDGREWRARRPQGTALHLAVREGFASVVAEAEERAGLPRRIRTEVERYLGCGDVRRGFVQVKCGTCRRTELVAFSCKQRGLCPSCGTRRSHEAAALCGELLPEEPYRQWTLSASFRARWALVKHPALLARMERRLVRAVWAWQRRSAKRLGASGRLQAGGMGLRQYFGSALQLSPPQLALAV
jgi:ribosomal protein S27E